MLLSMEVARSDLNFCSRIVYLVGYAAMYIELTSSFCLFVEVNLSFSLPSETASMDESATSFN